MLHIIYFNLYFKTDCQIYIHYIYQKIYIYFICIYNQDREISWGNGGDIDKDGKRQNETWGPPINDTRLCGPEGVVDQR